MKAGLRAREDPPSYNNSAPTADDRVLAERAQDVVDMVCCDDRHLVGYCLFVCPAVAGDRH